MKFLDALYPIALILLLSGAIALVGTALGYAATGGY
jgi:hypothetical protein